MCTPWPDCLLQAAADWGARRGGSLGAATVNAAAAANAASEALGLNDLGRAAANGDVGGGAIALASMLPVGKAAKAAKLAASEQLLGEAISGVGKVEAIAGAGTAAALRDAPRLAAQYGGAASDWAKMVGRTIKVDGHALQIHWYENAILGVKTEFKHNLP